MIIDFRKSIWSRRIALFCAIAAFATLFNLQGDARAQVRNIPGAEVRLPGFGAGDLRPPRPAPGKITGIRFLTSPDFPPFNFVDTSGTLVGFNVDLAREICLVLEVECTMTAHEWSSLPNRLREGAGDAVIASTAISAKLRAEFAFTNRYHISPARFVAQRSHGAAEVIPEALAGKNVGVIRGSAHAAYLTDFFSDALIAGFSDRLSARKALKDSEIDYLFDDGVSLMFWLNGSASEACCQFVGGPFYESRYFGEGTGIMVAKGNKDVREALDFGLFQLHENGKFLELYLRYFPISFY